MDLKSLNIQIVENGFIVDNHIPTHAPMHDKQWVFESATALSEFVKEWGIENTPVRPVKPAPRL